MGRVNIEDVDKYKGGQGAGFFNLENDKDVATVRFCHEGIESIEIINCHQIEIDGKKRKVSCLRSYDEPVDNCPFCAAGYPMQLRFFFHLLEYPVEKNGFGAPVKKIWERGRSVQKEILGLSARYSPLCDTAFEIERQGKKGDTQTKYGVYPMNYSLDELPISDEDLQIDSVVGSIVMSKTAEEMEYFLENNEFPPVEDEESDNIERRPVKETQQPTTQPTSNRREVAAPVNNRRRI